MSLKDNREGARFDRRREDEQRRKASLPGEDEQAQVAEQYQCRQAA